MTLTAAFKNHTKRVIWLKMVAAQGFWHRIPGSSDWNWLDAAPFIVELHLTAWDSDFPKIIRPVRQ
jgi:hypothetical protein